MRGRSGRDNTGDVKVQSQTPEWWLPDQPLAPLTTLGVGGSCRWLAPVKSEQELQQSWEWACREQIPCLFLGEGSNVVFSDGGFPGVVIQGRIQGVECSGTEVRVAGGESLERLIRYLNGRRLAGMERMYGIPGSLAGAIVGNAGAYGQEVADVVTHIEVWSPQGTRVLQAWEAGFAYRHSHFKKRRDWFILACLLRLAESPDKLQAISDEILRKRQEKYPPGLRCPGSFFKNVPVGELSLEALRRIPAHFIHFDKVPAGRLLEEVGANGVCRGGAGFASYHGNLLINHGGASSADLLALADEYAGRVWERFRVRLEAEVLIVDEGSWPHLNVLNPQRLVPASPGGLR